MFTQIKDRLKVATKEDLRTLLCTGILVLYPKRYEFAKNVQRHFVEGKRRIVSIFSGQSFFKFVFVGKTNTQSKTVV